MQAIELRELRAKAEKFGRDKEACKRELNRLTMMFVGIGFAILIISLIGLTHSILTLN